MENATSIVSVIDFSSYLTEIFIILGSGATAVLAYFIFRQSQNLVRQTSHLEEQTDEMKKTNLLAYSPFIAPRHQVVSGRRMLIFANVGSGSAINIKINLFDDDTNQPIGNFNRFALAAGENRTSSASFNSSPRIRIDGTYQNIAEDTITIQTIADLNELL